MSNKKQEEVWEKNFVKFVCLEKKCRNQWENEWDREELQARLETFEGVKCKKCGSFEVQWVDTRKKQGKNNEEA